MYNQQLLDALRTTGDVLQASHWFTTFVAEADRDFACEQWALLVAGVSNPDSANTWAIVASDGTVIRVSWTSIRISDTNGEFIATLSLGHVIPNDDVAAATAPPPDNRVRGIASEFEQYLNET